MRGPRVGGSRRRLAADPRCALTSILFAYVRVFDARIWDPSWVGDSLEQPVARVNA